MDIKSFTSLNQSKVLSKILPPESADMHYEDDISVEFGHGWHPQHLPCWSLAALLSVLPDDCGIDKEDGKYVASYIISDECGSYTEDNPIDACVAMIEYLHKINLL